MDNRHYLGLLPPQVQLKGQAKMSPFTKLQELAESFNKCQTLAPRDSPTLNHITQGIIEWSQNKIELGDQVAKKNIHFLIDLLVLLDKAKSSSCSGALKDPAFNDALFTILNMFLALRFRASEKHLKIVLALSYDKLIRWNIEQKNNPEYFLEKKGKIFSLI